MIHGDSTWREQQLQAHVNGRMAVVVQAVHLPLPLATLHMKQHERQSPSCSTLSMQQLPRVSARRRSCRLLHSLYIIRPSDGN